MNFDGDFTPEDNLYFTKQLVDNCSKSVFVGEIGKKLNS
jgi:hypothetical protein